MASKHPPPNGPQPPNPGPGPLPSVSQPVPHPPERKSSLINKLGLKRQKSEEKQEFQGIGLGLPQVTAQPQTAYPTTHPAHPAVYPPAISRAITQPNPQIFREGSFLSQSLLSVPERYPVPQLNQPNQFTLLKRGQVAQLPQVLEDEDLPDPIRVDRPFYPRHPSAGPSRLQQLSFAQSSPPPPPTPRKDTPPEKKKHKKRPTHTKSSPIKPSRAVVAKPAPRRVNVLKVECDSLHLYCQCNKKGDVSPGLHAKLYFGRETDPDDPLRDLDLTGLQLEKQGGLGIFGVEAKTPTSVLERDRLVTRADKANAVLRDPKLLEQVIQREHQLLLVSEKQKREEYEKRESIDRERERQAIAAQIEQERASLLAEEENKRRLAEEERDAKEAEEKRRRQVEEEYVQLKAEVEELRPLKEEVDELKRQSAEIIKLAAEVEQLKEFKRKSEEIDKLREEVEQLKADKRKSEDTKKKPKMMKFEGGTAYPESDADDEYERSVHDSSPVLATDDDETESEGSGGRTSNEHTPTTYGRMGRERDSTPEGIITDWNADECADFLASLGLEQYADPFIENEITGEALVALLHDDLKDVGIVSVGHRLTVLKAVYELKIKQDIPIDGDHYVPQSAGTEAQNAPATVRDIRALVEQLRIRDERLYVAEGLINKVLEDNRRLREDLLPVFKMAKEQQPLPYHPPAPQQNYAQQYAYANTDPNSAISPPVPTPKSSGLGSGGLQRKFSTKQFFLGSTPKNASPTHMQQQQQNNMMEQALDPSAAAERAVLSSSHLAAMNGGQSQTSPGLSPNIPSPSSPPHTLKNATLASRSYSSQSSMQTPRQTYQGASDAETLRASDQSSYQASTYTRDSVIRPPTSRRAPTPAPPGGGSASGADQIEVFKSFKVSMEDPCWKVLPAALKKYKIDAPTEQYALYIVYGDQERCLEADEKPLILFKELDRQGRKPMFMLRKTTAHPDGGVATMEQRGGVDGRLPLRNQQRQQYEPPGGII